MARRYSPAMTQTNLESGGGGRITKERYTPNPIFRSFLDKLLYGTFCIHTESILRPHTYLDNTILGIPIPYAKGSLTIAQQKEQTLL